VKTSINVYIDEDVRNVPIYGSRNPSHFDIFSSQVVAYRKIDVESRETRTDFSKIPKTYVDPGMDKMFDSYSYMLVDNRDVSRRTPLQDLSMMTIFDLAKVYKLCSQENMVVDKIYACSNIGGHICKLLRRDPELSNMTLYVDYGSEPIASVSVGRELLSKMQKVDRTTREIPGMQKHYFLKEIAGKMARDSSLGLIEEFKERFRQKKSEYSGAKPGDIFSSIVKEDFASSIGSLGNFSSVRFESPIPQTFKG